MKGTVKWYSRQRGYGFITDEDGNDHFVHHSGINSDKRFKSLNRNDLVEFEIGENANGPAAINVTVVKEGKTEE